MKAMSLEELTKEQLEELVRIYARNLLALDGVWFQSVERGRGMDEAMAHDCAVWRRFTETEARRIKTFLGLPERPGLDGLEQALAFRFAALANRRTECRRAGDALEFRVAEGSAVCGIPLQTLRLRKNLLIGCINRAGKILIPSGQDTIEPGDTVVVVTSVTGLNELDDILDKRRG